MIDVNSTADTEREIGSRDAATGEGQSILMRRRYEAEIEDVWDAVTNPDRLGRFFMKPAGELREGGTFSFEGNARGEILRCDPPRLLRITWVYGEPTGDEVEVRLWPEGDDRTVLELEHSSPGRLTDRLLNDPESGIWGLGAGWELGLIALDAFLRGELPDIDPAAMEDLAEITQLADQVSRAWAVVLEASDR
jgi:uncharacterized protein YndB with AHSA1/START domain